MSGEPADTVLLQNISTQLIEEDNIGALYEKIVDAAMAIMRSEYASLQRLYPERGQGGQLRLLAFRGFNAQAAAFWEWVRADSDSTCGVALRTGARVVAPDVERCEFMAATEDLATYRQTGIRAVQTTPLVSRAGTLVGMISTHWRNPHQPSERDLQLLDILARQAADLIERKRGEDALRAADRRKDEFLATLSHELRNPLAPIRNALALLHEAGGDSALAAKARGILDRQVAIMVRLVDDLLDITRLTRGRISLRTQPVPLAQVLAAAVEISRPLVEAGAHELVLRDAAPSATVIADPVRLAQALSNLLDNAARYTPRGGCIELEARADAGLAAVTVRDNGAGIAPHEMPRLFEMFTQGEGTRARAPGGLGVGLALARQLVELHGGTLEGHSDGAGRGATFTLRMPLHEAAVGVQAA